MFKSQDTVASEIDVACSGRIVSANEDQMSSSHFGWTGGGRGADGVCSRPVRGRISSDTSLQIEPGVHEQATHGAMEAGRTTVQMEERLASTSSSDEALAASRRTGKLHPPGMMIGLSAANTGSERGTIEARARLLGGACKSNHYSNGS